MCIDFVHVKIFDSLNDNDCIFQCVVYFGMVDNTLCSIKPATFIFLNSSMRHCPIFINLTLNDCNFVHLTLILLLHCLMKCRSYSLAFNNNQLLNSASFYEAKFEKNKNGFLFCNTV